MIRVVAAVIVKNNKILCAQRGPGKSLPYKWEFPGGKVEANESPKEALYREIIEELSCRIEVGKRIEQITYTYDFGRVHLTTFYCTLIDENPVRTEHASIKWLSPNELASLDWALADLSTVKKIEQDFSVT
ncbi:MAG TPA: (deoxy)nucleoside triphosphate pyrophosphohydrolase [Bacillota bacterium]